MDLGAIFLILAVVIVVVVVVARPLLAHTGELVSEFEHQYSALLAERDRILEALQELEFDFTLGKIPEEDYPQQRAALMSQGVAILQQIDALTPGKGKRQVKGHQDELEAKIAARRAERAAASESRKARFVSPPDDDLETLIAARKREKEERKEVTAGFCAQCGNPIHQNDRFCSKCGATLGAAQ